MLNSQSPYQVQQNGDEVKGLEWKQISTNENNRLLHDRVYQRAIAFENYILFFGNTVDNPHNKSIILFNLEELRWEQVLPNGESKLFIDSSYSVGIYQDKILFFGDVTLANLQDLTPAPTTGLRQERPIASSLLPQQKVSCLEILTITKVETKDSTLELEWNSIDASAIPLPSLTLPTINFYQDRIFLFGGQSENFQCSNSMIILTLGPQSSIVDLQSTPPHRNIESRWAHCSTLIEEKIYYYGGIAGDYSSLYDIDIFDIKTYQWAKLKPQLSLPQLKSGTFIQSFKDTLFFIDMHQESCDYFTYTISENTWKIIKTKNHVSCCLGGNFIAYYQGKIIFGEGFKLTELQLDENYQPKPKVSNKKDFYEADVSNFKDNDRRLFLEKPYPDVFFNVEGKQVPAHKGLLVARCSFFEKMFTSGMKETTDAVIEVPDIKLETFNGLLEYIYCNAVSFNEQLSLELLVLSDKYSLPNLRSLCESYLLKQLREDNVINIANIAEKCEAQKLKKTALKFIAQNSQAIFENQEVKGLSSSLIVQLVSQNF